MKRVIEQCNANSRNMEMPDNWEDDYVPVLDPTEDDADEDPDNDAIVNLKEYQVGTNPTVTTAGQATISTDSSVTRTGYSILVYSYCEFDVTVTGQLTIKIQARYKHWGGSFGDWVLKDTITDGWTIGNNYLSPDAVVWQLTFWAQFCTVEVKWEIWSGGDFIDTYSKSYSREPSGDIFDAYITLEDDTEIHYYCWYCIYQWGCYEL